MKNIHVVPSPNPSRLFIDEDDTKLRLYKEPMVSVYATNQNIYITNDEEIKEGDWFTDNNNSLKRSYKLSHVQFANPKKIILTTDLDLIKDGVQAIDDKFLEWFVKNPSCEEVEVEGHIYKGQDETEYRIIIPNLEVWKDVIGYEGLYQVNDYGNVKSLSRTITKGNITYVTKDRLLKQSVDSVGYPYVNLSDYKKQKTFRVHQLVAVAFLNHTPDKHKGLVIDHIDGDKLNNMITNLQLITNKKNTSKDRKNKTSKYTGVSWHKQSNKWLAQFRENGDVKYLGTFETEEEVRDAYNTSQERSYSEEEVYDIVEQAIKENSIKQLHFFDGGYSNPIYTNLKKWFEKFKKK
jgi:hypothetical protein